MTSGMITAIRLSWSCDCGAEYDDDYFPDWGTVECSQCEKRYMVEAPIYPELLTHKIVLGRMIKA